MRLRRFSRRSMSLRFSCLDADWQGRLLASSLPSFWRCRPSRLSRPIRCACMRCSRLQPRCIFGRCWDSLNDLPCAGHGFAPARDGCALFASLRLVPVRGVDCHAHAILFARDRPARGALARLVATQSSPRSYSCPWLVVLAGRALTVVDGRFWIPLPDAGFLLENTLRVIPAAAAILVLLTLAAWIALQPRRREAGAGVLLVLSAILGPLAIALALSFAVKPILIDRYMIFAGRLPLRSALALLVRSPVPPLLQAAAVLAVAGFMVLPARAIRLLRPALVQRLALACREPGKHDARGRPHCCLSPECRPCLSILCRAGGACCRTANA